MYGSLCLSPVRELGILREAMNDLFSGVSGAVHEFPPVNIYSNDNGAVVKAELPGVNPEQLELTVVNSVLTLKGSRSAYYAKANESNADVRALRRERISGTFARTLTLPFKVESAAVSAHFDKGVLTVTLPRAESDKPRKIAIATV